jgi:hypothetical protein
MHVGSLHGHDEELFFFQKPSAFDYSMDGLCEGGVWGLSQLENHSRQSS